MNLISKYPDIPDASKIKGNTVRFRHYSVSDSLSQNTILSILQDSQGFMWFGTENGLNRFDGYTFIVFRHDREDPTSLSSDQRIRVLFEDKSGAIWIGTRYGLNKFDPSKEQFVRYLHSPDDPDTLSGNEILSICQDKADTLWVGTTRGLNKLDPNTETFTRYPNDIDNANGNRIRTFFEDKDGNFLIGTEGAGLFRFDRDAGQFVEQYSKAHGLSSDTIRTMYGDAQAGVLWICTLGGGVCKFDLVVKTFKSYRHKPDNPNSLSGDDVVAIFADDEGRLWLGTFDEGLNIFDIETETFTHFRNEPGNPASLSDNTVVSIYEDRSGLLWFGTEINGINTLDCRATRNFSHYAQLPNDPNSLKGKRVMTVCEYQEDILFIGTDEGLDKFDRAEGKFTHLHNPDDSASLPSQGIIYIYKDSGETLWLGTRGSGLVKFDPETETFFAYTASNGFESLPDAYNVMIIYEDKSGYIWFGTEGDGLYRYNKKKETFKKYLHNRNDPNSLSGDLISAIYEDHNNTLWIGTEGDGLNKFSPDQKTFTHYQSNLEDSNSLSDNSIYSIYEDQSNTLWICTGSGLNKFNPQTETFTVYTTKDGLPNNRIYGILEDSHKNFWLSTDFGLSKFNPQTEKIKDRFRNYDSQDGLQDNEFQTGAYYKSKSGEMFFGGINGFNAFYPEAVQDNPYAPPIVLTKFQILNKDVENLDKSLSQITELTLTHKDLVFSFKFAALDFAAPEKNQYAYQLVGFDEDWVEVEAGNPPLVVYTNIDSGTYTFRVKGSNNDGIWNEAGLATQITITPPGPDDIAIRRIDKLRRAVQEMAKELTTSIRLNQQDILRLMSHQTQNLIKTNQGYVVLYDPDKNLLQIPFIREFDQDEPITDEPVEITDQTTNDLIKRLLKDGEPTLIPNVEDWYQKQNIPLQSNSDLKSWLGVQLIIQDKILGGITLQNENLDAYQQDDKEVLQIMTDLSAIAIQNFQLIGELDQKLEREKKLRQFANELSHTATSERIKELLDEE